jgi:hypothetical protein
MRICSRLQLKSVGIEFRQGSSTAWSLLWVEVSQMLTQGTSENWVRMTSLPAHMRDKFVRNISQLYCLVLTSTTHNPKTCNDSSKTKATKVRPTENMRRFPAICFFFLMCEIYFNTSLH